MTVESGVISSGQGAFVGSQSLLRLSRAERLLVVLTAELLPKLTLLRKSSLWAQSLLLSRLVPS